MMPPVVQVRSRLGWLALITIGGAAASCATGEMQPPAMPAVTQEFEVRVLDGGFVEFEDERQPVEAAVLTLRQRVRSMAEDAVAGIRVTIAIGEAADDSAIAISDMLMTHLQLMGIRNARID